MAVCDGVLIGCTMINGVWCCCYRLEHGTIVRCPSPNPISPHAPGTVVCGGKVVSGAPNQAVQLVLAAREWRVETQDSPLPTLRTPEIFDGELRWYSAGAHTAASQRARFKVPRTPCLIGVSEERKELVITTFSLRRQTMEGGGPEVFYHCGRYDFKVKYNGLPQSAPRVLPAGSVLGVFTSSHDNARAFDPDRGVDEVRVSYLKIGSIIRVGPEGDVPFQHGPGAKVGRELFTAHVSDLLAWFTAIQETLDRALTCSDHDLPEVGRELVHRLWANFPHLDFAFDPGRRVAWVADALWARSWNWRDHETETRAWAPSPQHPHRARLGAVADMLEAACAENVHWADESIAPLALCLQPLRAFLAEPPHQSPHFTRPEHVRAVGELAWSPARWPALDAIVVHDPAYMENWRRFWEGALICALAAVDSRARMPDDWAGSEGKLDDYEFLLVALVMFSFAGETSVLEFGTQHGKRLRRAAGAWQPLAEHAAELRADATVGRVAAALDLLTGG